MEMLMQAQEDSQCRQECIRHILERVVSQWEARNNHEDDQAGTTHSTSQQRKLSAGTVVAPHLSSSASLREFDAWRHKLIGYVMLMIFTLPNVQQGATLMSVLDDVWTRSL